MIIIWASVHDLFPSCHQGTLSIQILLDPGLNIPECKYFISDLLSVQSSLSGVCICRSLAKQLGPVVYIK